jgi:hypothetical protein
MDNSVNAWNSTPTVFNIVKIAGADIVAAQFSATWSGRYSSSGNNFTIELNARVIADPARCTNVSNCISSVFSHEFGHVFYQDDNPPVDKFSSVMRADRNRSSSTMRGPKQYDIDETNAYVP